MARRQAPAAAPRLWRRVLEGLGGGSTAQAATTVAPPVRTAIISVRPFVRADDGAEP